MDDRENEEVGRRKALSTLTRLANSCERAAARGKNVLPMAPDLDEQDYREIADILKKLAATIEHSPT